MIKLTLTYMSQRSENLSQKGQKKTKFPPPNLKFNNSLMFTPYIYVKHKGLDAENITKNLHIVPFNKKLLL